MEYVTGAVVGKSQDTVSLRLRDLQNFVKLVKPELENLTDESRTYLMGKQTEARINRDKFKGNQYTSGGSQNDTHQTIESHTDERRAYLIGKQKTSEKIATEQKVSPATVNRALEYSRAVDNQTAKNNTIKTRGEGRECYPHYRK